MFSKQRRTPQVQEILLSSHFACKRPFIRIKIYFLEFDALDSLVIADDRSTRQYLRIKHSAILVLEHDNAYLMHISIII